jgi:hypothetical protein
MGIISTFISHILNGHEILKKSIFDFLNSFLFGHKITVEGKGGMPEPESSKKYEHIHKMDGNGRGNGDQIYDSQGRYIRTPTPPNASPQNTVNFLMRQVSGNTTEILGLTRDYISPLNAVLDALGTPQTE